MGRGRAKAKQAVMADVPDLRGLTVTEAEALASRVDLLISDPDGRPATGLAGVIIGQRPALGTLVRRLTAVMVWTSGPGGEAGVREPAVPPLPRRQAGGTADRAG